MMVLADRAEDLPVEEVHRVDGEQNGQREPCSIGLHRCLTPT
jgi:hypothetical protein